MEPSMERRERRERSKERRERRERSKERSKERSISRNTNQNHRLRHKPTGDPAMRQAADYQKQWRDYQATGEHRENANFMIGFTEALLRNALQDLQQAEAKLRDLDHKLIYNYIRRSDAADYMVGYADAVRERLTPNSYEDAQKYLQADGQLEDNHARS